MKRLRTTIRRPVQRQGAGHYLLLTLLSFAASVTLTRLFLELTGYPQLGGGTFHIAHVLWGGLLLYIAALLPLIFANRWVYTIGAVLGGAGVGLFIDEVGKFITAENDYFFPLAAPIIYAFFLLTVLLYNRMRRPVLRQPRAELYQALDAMEEVLEHDLDPEERSELEERLKFVVQYSDAPEQSILAARLLEFLHSEEIHLAEKRLGPVERLLEWLKQYETRFDRPRLKALIALALLALGISGLVQMVRAAPVLQDPGPMEDLLARLIAAGQISGQGGLFWFFARLLLEAALGLLLVFSALMIAARREDNGTFFGYWGLLISLTTVDLLVFYFDQFSTILIAIFQFVALSLIGYYRRRFLDPEKQEERAIIQPEPDHPS